MDYKKSSLIIFMMFGFLFFVPAFLAHADDDQEYGKRRILLADNDSDDDKGRHHKEKRAHHQKRGNDTKAILPATHSVYLDQCGACHFAYPAELLPEASWVKILANLDDHFGESIDMDVESKNSILEYLKASSADHSGTKRGRKIMKGLTSQAPLRISQLPYITKEHHEISPDVLKRKSIGSLANCIACHTKAQDGEFDDDDVKIPQ